MFLYTFLLTCISFLIISRLLFHEVLSFRPQFAMVRSVPSYKCNAGNEIKCFNVINFLWLSVLKSELHSHHSSFIYTSTKKFLFVLCAPHANKYMPAHTHKIKNWKRIKHQHLQPISREGVKITSCHNVRYIGPLKINMADIWQYQICIFWLTSLPNYPRISESVSNHKTRAKTWCTEKRLEKTAFIVFMHYSEENKDDIHTAFLPVLHSKRSFISTFVTHVNDVISSTFILMPTCTLWE